MQMGEMEKLNALKAPLKKGIAELSSMARAMYDISAKLFLEACQEMTFWSMQYNISIILHAYN